MHVNRDADLSLNVINSFQKFAAAGGSARCLMGGGTTNNASSGMSDVIDYYQSDVLSAASDFGDLLAVIRLNPAGVSNAVRGLWGGGYYTSGAINIIQYVTIADTGSSQDFGDLVASTLTSAGCASETRGCWGGGS